MQIGQKAGRAGALLFTRKVWAGILNLFVISYLARVLDKEDFGLISIAAVFTEIMNITWLGVGDFLIYKNKGKDIHIISAVFWLNFFLILLIISILIFSAPYLAYYYHNEKIKSVIYILTIGYTGIILSNVPQALLKSDFDFKPIIIAQTVTGTLSQLSQLGLAIMGFGVYSLAIPGALFPIVSGIYLLIKVKPKIKLNIEIAHWKEIIAYIRFIIGSKLLGRFAADGDSLIIGKTLGLTSLGVYNIASRFSNLLNQNLMPILEDVSFPLFVKYNQNNSIVRKQFLYVTRLTSILLIPFYVLLILFAPLIITTLCGDKWYDAVLPLRILCMFSLVESVTYSTGILYNALGKPKIKFYFTLIFTPIFLVLVWIFSAQGLVLACIVVTVLKMINFVYHVYRAGRIINLTIFNFLKEIQHILIPNILLAIVYFSILYFLHNINVKYLMMVMYMPAIYLITFRLYKKDMLKDYLLVCKVFPFIKVR